MTRSCKTKCFQEAQAFVIVTVDRAGVHSVTLIFRDGNIMHAQSISQYNIIQSIKITVEFLNDDKMVASVTLDGKLFHKTAPQ